MNPLSVQSKDVQSNFLSWKDINVTPYDKNTTSPYSKTRLILMTGTEFESNWFLHQFARNCSDNELRREIATVRCQEQQQQKRLALLKPIDENVLETTIAYEQLAIDLTAILAQHETDENNKKALDFALLEDFDHLYRFANLLKMDYGIDSKALVGGFTEITPGRPTINEHRHPKDNVRTHFNAKTANLYTKLVGNIITGAEQQTMNFYMNVANTYKNALGRKLYTEIAMVEEEHVTQYESLVDPTTTWLEKWVMHEYTECYLYYSMMQDETDEYIRSIYKQHFEMEVAHLKKAVSLLEKYEQKSASDVVGNGEFPTLLSFASNKQYIRQVLKTVGVTSIEENYVPVCDLNKNSRFFTHLDTVNGNEKSVASHIVIEKAIARFGQDFRYEDKPNPIKSLQNRTEDDVTAGRVC